MSEQDGSEKAAAPPPVPRVHVERRRQWNTSLIWLVPIVAALIGIGMVIHNWASEGPQIEISFITAEGLEAGKTQVKYKDVVIGLVDSIGLAKDRTHIIAHVKLDKDASTVSDSARVRMLAGAVRDLAAAR